MNSTWVEEGWGQGKLGVGHPQTESRGKVLNGGAGAPWGRGVSPGLLLYCGMGETQHFWFRRGGSWVIALGSLFGNFLLFTE